mgnify:CR=1 FL=1
MTDETTPRVKPTLMRPGGVIPAASAPVVTPLMPSVVYASETPDALDDQYEGRARGYTYAREGHPNAEVLARRIDALEGMEGGLVTASGMAAVTAALMGICRAGDHVVVVAPALNHRDRAEDLVGDTGVILGQAEQQRRQLEELG